jgi:2-haloacid dehalogenase
VPTVVFDLGGVLIDWNPRHLYRKLIADEAEMERFLGEVCTMTWNLRLDAGLPFEQGVAELVARFPAQADLIRPYHERWIEMVAGEIADTVGILGELHSRRIPLWALSNWSTSTFALIRDRFQFLEWFDGLVLSGDVGVTKPGERIYRELLARSGRAAGDCIFIDDNPANTEAAERLGFRTILFETPERLRRDLVLAGLLDSNADPSS